MATVHEFTPRPVRLPEPFAPEPRPGAVVAFVGPTGSLLLCGDQWRGEALTLLRGGRACWVCEARELPPLAGQQLYQVRPFLTLGRPEGSLLDALLRLTQATPGVLYSLHQGQEG